MGFNYSTNGSMWATAMGQDYCDKHKKYYMKKKGCTDCIYEDAGYTKNEAGAWSIGKIWTEIH